MEIREERVLAASTREDRQQVILDAIMSQPCIKIELETKNGLHTQMCAGRKRF